MATLAVVTAAEGGQAEAAARYMLEPEFSVTETYDDNVNREDADREDDYVTGVSVGLRGSADGRWFRAAARYRLGTEFFAEGTEEQGLLAHDASVEGSYRATPNVTLGGSDVFRLSETAQPASTAAIPEPGSGEPTSVPPPPSAVLPDITPTRRVRRLDNGARVFAGVMASSETDVNLGVAYAISRFDAAGLVDSDTYSASAGVSHRVSSTDRVGLGYEGSLFRFPGTDRPDRQSHGGSLRWQRAWSAFTTASMTAGGTLTEGVGGGSLRFAGFTGGASLESRLVSTRFQIAYVRAVRTGGGTGDVQIEDRATLGLSRDLSARVTGDVGAAYLRSDAVDGPSAVTETYSGTIRLAMRLTPSLRLQAGYSHERVDGSAGGADFYVNRATLGLTWTPEPLRSRAF